MGASNNGALSTTLRCKVAVVGNGACGKSALCKAFKSQGGAFPRQYAMTAGVDLTVAPVRLPPPPGPPAGGVPPATVNVELFLFDSGGQRMYKERAARYWDAVSLGIVCYDCSNRDSFDSAPRWIQTLKELRRSGANAQQVPVALVACKCDQSGYGCVSAEEGQALADAHGMAFFETSATPPGKGVDAPFEHVAKTFAEQYEEAVAKATSAR